MNLSDKLSELKLDASSYGKLDFTSKGFVWSDFSQLRYYVESVRDLIMYELETFDGHVLHEVYVADRVVQVVVVELCGVGDDFYVVLVARQLGATGGDHVLRELDGRLLLHIENEDDLEEIDRHVVSLWQESYERRASIR